MLVRSTFGYPFNSNIDQADFDNKRAGSGSFCETSDNNDIKYNIQCDIQFDQRIDYNDDNAG